MRSLNAQEKVEHVDSKKMLEQWSFICYWVREHSKVGYSEERYHEYIEEDARKSRKDQRDSNHTG